MASGHGASLIRAVAAAVIATLVGVGVWYGVQQRGAAGTRPTAASLVPADAQGVIWTDELAALGRGLLRLQQRMPDSSGLVDAAAMLLKLPGIDAESLRSVGLDPDSPVVVYRWRGGIWVALAVGEPRGAEHLWTVLRNRGHVVEAAESGDSWRIQSRDGSEVIAAADLLGGTLVVRGPDRLAVAVAANSPNGHTLPTAATPTALADLADLATWQAAPRIEPDQLTATAGDLHARWQLGKDSAIRKLVRRSLGPAALLFGGYVGSFERVALDVSLDVDNPLVRLQLLTAPGRGADVRKYHQDFIADDSPALLDVGDILPDEPALLVRARVNPRLAAMASGLLRMAGAMDLGVLHPSLRALDTAALLVALLDGQLAVALLGISDEANPDPRTWPRSQVRANLGLAVALSLTNDTAAQTLLARIRALLTESQVKVAAAKLGAWQGFSVLGAGAPWSLVRRGRALLWLGGDGELARFERVDKGRFPSLGRAVSTPLEKELVAGHKRWLGALITTGRIVRSARRRGIPDSLTKMLASVSALAVGVQLHDDGLTVDVQLRPQQAPGGHARATTSSKAPGAP